MQRTANELRHALADLVRDGTPAISLFAAWALDHPDEIALFSLREVALRAQANPNTVYRFAVALGYSGFDACRRNFQSAFMRPLQSYGERAQRLVDRDEGGLIEGIRRTTALNVDSVLSPENASSIQDAADLLLTARHVHCIGVRSSFALAHYLSYTGLMAFPSFSRPIVEAGSILDVLSGANEADVAVLITFSRYSSELLRAHKVATERGVRVIAISDSYASPIARGAQIVFTLPMQGPQTLPSFTAGFALVEAIIGQMISTDPKAPSRIADFESRLAAHGAYGP
jgi:DNA-binding MurR/RpiR family transcriptional regulator